MIHLFEFSGVLLEFANSGGKPSTVFYTIYDLFQGNCIIIYRYELARRESDPMLTYIFRKPFKMQRGNKKERFVSCKFGTNKSHKIDFEKLKGDNIILMHLDVYRDDPDSIRKLLDFCVREGKNLYLPVSDGNSTYFFKKSDFSDNPHRYRIKEIIEQEYEHVRYDFREAHSASSFGKLLREMKIDLTIRNLLG